MHRLYDHWTPVQDQNNEFYTTFRYSPISGIGKERGVSRRDPSKILKLGDTYYVWYTLRNTDVDPVGRNHIALGSDTTPVVDWDLADIGYATSKDGFHWTEKGVAVARAPMGTYGDRSLSTPDVLFYRGRFYLFYQCFTTMWREHDCVSVSMAYAESPDGPWTRVDEPVVAAGSEGEWDSCAIHDPYPLIYQGQIWLYYKGTPANKSHTALRLAQGVAIAQDPMGAYVKSPLNPVSLSGHETMLWPYKEGIAALQTADGPEKNTVQFAPNGLNFAPKAHIQVPPIAGGPFCPDAFADNGDGRGITWGLSHIGPDPMGGQPRDSFIIRWDCSLCRDVERKAFKGGLKYVNEDTFFQPMLRLPDDLKQQILGEQAQTDSGTILS